MPNCKPGDLARVIGFKHLPENVGAIVHVIERIRPGDQRPDGLYFSRSKPLRNSYWLCEGVSRPLIYRHGKPGAYRIASGQFASIRDDFLEPLRPAEDGVDEIIQLVGLPTKENEHA